jgi:hypothetical protein
VRELAKELVEEAERVEDPEGRLPIAGERVSERLGERTSEAYPPTNFYRVPPRSRRYRPCRGVQPGAAIWRKGGLRVEASSSSLSTLNLSC